MKKIFILFFVLFSFTLLYSQDIEEIFKDKGEIYFQTEIEDHTIIEKLTRIISIDGIQDNKVFAYANKKEFKQFLEIGLAYKILPHPNEGFNPQMATFEQIQNADNWSFYPTYDAYVALMYQFEANYPGICDVFSIGQSVNGRDLLVAKISDNVSSDEAEPEFFYTSSMHGDELTGYPLMLNLIDSLLSEYGSNTRITNLVNEMEIYINPLANPDGTFAGGNNTVSGATRYNANWVDLNRNYPDPVGGQHPDNKAWQPETINFMNFAESRDFVMAANFHGGAEVFNYPWDHKFPFHPDDDWWKLIGHEYADTAQAYSPTGYMNGFDDGITNGADWYLVYGGRQDYMNYFHQCKEVTIEISDTKLIPASQLLAHWEYNRRSLLNYMEQCLYGIRGIVTDAASGLPIEAEIFLLNHDEDSTWVYSSLPAGNYHRQINTGSYDLRFSAPCYETQILNNVSLLNYTTTVIDVQLIPSIADFTANSTSAIVGQNVEFTDMSCQTATSWGWSFSGPGNAVFVNGTNTNSQNPVVQFDAVGYYSVTLNITGAFGSDDITKTDYIYVGNCSYCASFYSNTSDDWISNVSFNTINNSSGSVGYEDFTSISTELAHGSSHNLSVTITVNGSWVQHCFAYFDWNQDCDFEDTGEAYDLGQVTGTGTLNLMIAVPADAAAGQTRMRITELWNNNPGPCQQSTYGETEDYSVVITNGQIELDVTVMLEGPYNGIDMDAALQGLNDFPLSQPFNTSPWNYTGTESVVSLPNTNVVDWVLIELRDAANASAAIPATMMDKQAGFVLRDGSVVGPDGYSFLQFDDNITQQLFVVVTHHNHIDIMSSVALSGSNGKYTYDFTTAASQAYGLNAQKDLGGGAFGMYGGDSNADGMVDDLDLSASWTSEAGMQGYLSSDINLDGQSNNVDKNVIWLPNSGNSSQVPD
ncbi:MAG: hypothetical protein K9G76_03540 [Bacteroidales bacterium]|nr:hypothetical protein [Bacteroidales bacterium]MCF8402867.1 hypothetical protein [Bacteroidales bacterium]